MSTNTSGNSESSSVEPIGDDDRANARIAKRVEVQIAGVALRHLKPEGVEPGLSAYAQHVQSLPPEHRASLTGDALSEHADGFMRAHAAAHPEHARDVPTINSRQLQKRHGVNW